MLVRRGTAGAEQAHGRPSFGHTAGKTGKKERREEGKKKEGRRKEKREREKRKEMGEREREKERERGGVSTPVAAATMAGRPRARGIRALHEERRR
jgi:hypothetical protein